MGVSKAPLLRHMTNPANPPAGALLLYAKSDGKIYTKDSAGVETDISTGGGGGGSAVVPVQTAEPASPATGQMFYDSDEPTPALGEFTDLTLTTDYTTTTPVTPTTGLKMFARHRARRLPTFVGPSGQDSQLQPALFTNRIARINSINNVATPTFDGIAVTNVAAPTATPAVTNTFYNAMVRHRYGSAATAGSAAGFRSSNVQWFTSSTANMGGMFMVCRFGLNAITATNRIFIGFSTTSTALAAGTNPSAFLNMFGFAADSTHTTFRFMNNDGTGTATSVDLGANFPAQTAATYFYEFRIFVPSGAGNVVYWSAHRLNDGLLVQGGPITTDLPALPGLFAFHFHHSNGTTATAVSTDLQSLYIETDN